MKQTKKKVASFTTSHDCRMSIPFKFYALNYSKGLFRYCRHSEQFKHSTKGEKKPIKKKTTNCIFTIRLFICIHNTSLFACVYKTFNNLKKKIKT